MTSYMDGSTVFIGDFDESVDGMMLDLVDLVKRKIMIAADTGPDEDPPHIEFWINSMGGDSHRAFSLVSLIEWAKEAGVQVNTIVLAEAASSGSIVAVAGTPGYRRCTPNSIYTQHYGEVDINAVSPVDLRRQSNMYQEHFKKIALHYDTHTNKDYKWWDKTMTSDNHALIGQDAIDLGMADGFL